MKLPVTVDQKGHDWAQKQLAQMTLPEKIGQLIHIAAWSNRGSEHEDEVRALISDYNIGGLIFFQGNPEQQAKLTNAYQTISKTPLMVSMDAEWGAGMRLDGVEPFPYQMTLGAIQDHSLIEEMGSAVARQLRRIGVNVNHAPVIDVNTNPDNPVINFRSFGENKHLVALCGNAYMKGMQKENVLACAKHFPGHGDTAVDSHKALPLLDKSMDELMGTELYPFDQLIKKGLGAVMLAHLQIPQLEPEIHKASSLSKPIVTELLREQLGFQGLSFTDALDMRAVADHYEPGKVDLEAFLAGNDILLFVRSVPKAVSEITKAIESGMVSVEELDRRCLKQLIFKYWLGLHQFEEVVSKEIQLDVNRSTPSLNKELYQSAVTLIQKEKPFPASGEKVLLISLFADGDKPEEGSLAHHTLLKGAIGDKSNPLFEQEMALHLKEGVERVTVGYNELSNKQSEILAKAGSYDKVVIAVHDLKLKAFENFGFTTSMLDLCDQLPSYSEVHLVLFGNPYSLRPLKNGKSLASVLVTYQENEYTHQTAAKILSNGLLPIGKLPVSINDTWRQGHGLTE